jgi:membrane protein required for colicin V production
MSPLAGTTMEPHSGLNNLDLIVIGIVMLSGLLALMRGFTREIFSLFAWAGAWFAAVHFYPVAMPWMKHYVKNDKAVEWAAMATVFFIALILLMILGSLVSMLIKGRALTLIDRSLGFVYGIVRGILVVCLIYLGAVMILWPDIDKPTPPVAYDANGQPVPDKDRNPPPQMLVEARTRPMLAFGASKLTAFVPQDLIDKSLQKIEMHKDALDKADAQKTLDRLSTPTPPPPQTATAPGDITPTEGR